MAQKKQESIDFEMLIEFDEADNTLHLPQLERLSEDAWMQISHSLTWELDGVSVPANATKTTITATKSGEYAATLEFPQVGGFNELQKLDNTNSSWLVLAKNIPNTIWQPDRLVKLVGKIKLDLEPTNSNDARDPLLVRLTRTSAPPTGDIGLWMLIKESSENLSWKNYIKHIDLVFSRGANYPTTTVSNLAQRRNLPFIDSDSYRALKVATEAFLLVNTPTVPCDSFSNEVESYMKRRTDFNSQEVKNAFNNSYLISADSDQRKKMIPYLYQVAENLKGTAVGGNAEARLEEYDATQGVLGEWNQTAISKLSQPMLIELIWSYWMEEMQLVQTMHAVSRRFQNVHSGNSREPLASFDTDFLSGLRHVLFGYVQDEQHRLTLTRRAYEYSHHYGFSLIGKAVPQLRPADNRSKFIEAFHNLLGQCVPFYLRIDDTTVRADAFPLLNALREVHLLLSEGAGNQFRDLPATARVEMLMEQWILARPEFREFLPRRASIAYPEPWMHSVDSMRRLQGWGDTNVLHFWHLATCGERIVSSIRWGNWNVQLEPESAANWASFFRSDIQSYIHAYRAVTGVDITLEPVDSTMPSVHLYRRQAADALKRA